MERKTLDQRDRMTDLERLRHSAAHVLATAILKIWPDAQFAAGPPVDDGFYYDLELDHRISTEDFPKIEAEMKIETKANHVFEKITVDRAQALADAQKGRLGALGERGAPSKFKLDIIQGIPEGEPITYFKNGDFIDLCAGPHVMRTGNVGAFKLTSVASAYYKGDEKNPQLQRIYGTAFKNKTEMEAHFAMLEEAKKRDHRKLGAEMGLYVIDPEYVGPGLPLWLPKGTVIVEELEKLAKETEFAAGYARVKTPHLAKEKMYKTSGHLPYYQDSMFPPMELTEVEYRHRAMVHVMPWLAKRDELSKEQQEIFEAYKRAYEIRKREEREDIDVSWSQSDVWDEVLEQLPTKESGEVEDLARIRLLSDLNARLCQEEVGPAERYYLKAMNCPHHHRIFAAEPRSYRDLPLRLAEYGGCFHRPRGMQG